MADQVKVFAPRQPTPTPGAARSVGRTSGRLPEELLSEQVRRLAVFSAVIGSLWTYALLAEFLLVPIATGATGIDWTAIVVELTWMTISAAMLLYVRFTKATPEHKTTAGLVFMICNAVGISLFNTWIVPQNMIPNLQLSWITILILVFSMISPTAPRRMLVASLVAASMDPLSVWIAYLTGRTVPSGVTVFLQFLPNYICAFVAVLPAQALQHLGRRLQEAQDLGSYQLIELLGKGGMGEVWRAEHRLLARSAAVKLVRPEVLGAGTQHDVRLTLRRFEREAQATAALSSPHTIHVFDYGMTNEGNFYYVMELLAGRNLESLVREFGPLPSERAVFLLRQICHSLADAHARGLVHRDIKPANIFTCRMGLEYDFVKVLDFGLVKFNNRPAVQQTTLLTLEQRTIGTPAYMAPEIILGESDVDRRADVYALGCVIYYLVTGQLVFEADTSMKMLMQHVQAVPVPPSQRTELRIPREVDALVLRCLEKDPDKRPQSAEDLLNMVYSHCSCGGWTQELSRRWWERHLPELTGPLTVSEHDSEAAIAVGAAQ